MLCVILCHKLLDFRWKAREVQIAVILLISMYVELSRALCDLPYIHVVLSSTKPVLINPFFVLPIKDFQFSVVFRCLWAPHCSAFVGILQAKLKQGIAIHGG